MKSKMKSKMKKLARVLAVALVGLFTITFTSCEKEDYMDCNCGLVTDDGIDSGYWVEIRNDCSGNIKRFYLTQGDWFNAHVGSDYCITNVESWKTTPQFTGDEEDRLELIKIK